MQRIFAALILGAAATASAAAGFTLSNAPGPYPVGLRVTAQYDYSRVYKPRVDLVSGQQTTGERARPIQALVWYPAQRKGTPVIYRDYLATVATEDDLAAGAERAQRATNAYVAGLASGPRAEQVRQEIARPMWALRDAPEHAGKFPVVIYAPSFSASAIENADLCEYLASQGYLVIASPSLGPRSRSMTTELEGAEAQAADIAFLIGYAHSLPQADTSHIAVVGFSWGGLANVLAAAKDDRISALVSLDGSMRGTTEYVNGGKDAAKYVTPARLALPLLYIAKRRYSPEELQKREIDTSFSLMNQMKYSDVYIATMPWMAHMDFTSQHLRFAGDGEFEEYSRDEASLAHSWVARYVHRFLDAYLKGDAAARAFLNNSPAQNKVPAHMMSLDIRHGNGMPPTLETFVRKLNSGGFGNAIGLYQQLHAEDARFSLDQGWINRWGYQLLRGGREKEAVGIFRLGTHLYPNDGNLFDSLAEACETTGDREQAIANYRRSLELDPKNGNAVQRLKLLGASATAADIHAAR